MAGLIRKYTGGELDLTALAVNPECRAEANALMTAVNELSRTERDLAQCADRLADTGAKIRENLAAGHGDRVRSLNPLGELQADRTDMLIAVRDQQIRQLQELVNLAVRAQERASR